ncbi:MAG: hypothetical protein ACRDZU_02190 [Acidimicrobiales bacterium]
MRRSPLIAVLGVALALTSCGSDDPDDAVTDERVEQVRQAAVDAGLSDEVADVLALAARGATATFQITYAGADGAEIMVSQQPPNRRVDALTAGLIVESQLVRDNIGYLCDLPDGGQPGDPLDCHRTQGAIPAQGTFTDEALDTFSQELIGSARAMDLTVEMRTIAEAEATCLIAAPKAGTPIDETTPGVDTICLSGNGAQLLVDAGGERVVAATYSTEVPEGTFDVSDDDQ